ncbi:MAG: lysylphosphatidylglycerol synthase transmembrane domain-containing protein [Actinomycetes bacterium]
MTPRRQRSRTLVRGALMLALAAVGFYVVWPSLTAVVASVPSLADIRPAWFVAMAGLEISSFVCLWMLSSLALHTDDLHLVATAQLASNAFSRVVPGGAAAGGALQYRMLVRGGVPAPVTALGLTAITLLSTGGVLLLPLLSIPTLLSDVAIDRSLVTTLWIGIALVLVVAAVGAVLAAADEPVRLIGRATQTVMNAVRRYTEPVTDLPDRLVAARNRLRTTLGSRWHMALVWTAGKVGFDYLALLAALAAVNARPRPALVLVAFVASVVLGMIPVTPGGLGFVEAGLTTTLALAGVPAALAATATLAYRLVQYWLPLPLGAAGYAIFRHRYGGVPTPEATP